MKIKSNEKLNINKINENNNINNNSDNDSIENIEKHNKEEHKILDNNNQTQDNLIELTEEEAEEIEGSLQETIELSILYDFYGELLTKSNKEVFTEYVFNDLSLSEIAEKRDITRQGVHDIVKRTSKKLREYEETLKLVTKFKIIERKINRIKELGEKLKLPEEPVITKEVLTKNQILDEINELTEEILKVL